MRILNSCCVCAFLVMLCACADAADPHALVPSTGQEDDAAHPPMQPDAALRWSAQDAAIVDAAIRDDATSASPSVTRPAAEIPPVATGCVSNVSAGKRTLPCGEISFDLSVPESCLMGGCGLILDAHGGTMSGAQEEKNTRIAELGGKRGYIVIQPSAIVRFFLQGDVLPQWIPSLDDEQVLRILHDVMASFHVDEARVHVTGFSQGSLMTWRLICAHAELFASAAPISGSWPKDAEQDCSFVGDDRPSRELPVLNVQGKLDPRSPFDQAIIKRDNVIRTWNMDKTERVAGDDKYLHTRFSNARGNVFEFIEHSYRTDAEKTLGPWHVALEGHCYPGSEDFTATLPGQQLGYGCLPPTAFKLGELILDFFDRHPRRAL